jgi:hypothetical protein
MTWDKNFLGDKERIETSTLFSDDAEDDEDDDTLERKPDKKDGMVGV